MAAALYRRKSKPINAEQFDGTEESASRLGLSKYEVKSKGAEGWCLWKDSTYQIIRKGDWILSDSKANKSTVGAEDFSKQYEKV